MVESIKILIVDDDPGIRLALHDFLIQNGFTDVTAAANGYDALVYLRSNTPQLIISDITMPQMDGYELSKSLRGQDTTREIPIIMVTTEAGDADRKAGLEAGVTTYLSKPISPQRLLYEIEKLI